MNTPEPRGRPPRPQPDVLTVLSLALLAVVAALLLLPLTGPLRPPVWVIAALLLCRVGVQVWRSRRLQRAGGRASAGWVLDLVLIGLLLYVGSNPK